jgi:tripartite-type tricarboxylate transporter receptor subunit TctC
MMSRAHQLLATLVVMLAAASVSPATAQTADPAKDYPARPIRIIAPFGPGGPGDIFSRQLAQYLAESRRRGLDHWC